MYARPRSGLPTYRSLGWRIIDVREARGADPHRRPALRRARLPGHVAGRPGGASSASRSRRSTTTSTRRRTCSGRSPGRAPKPSTRRSTPCRPRRPPPSESGSRCARTSPSSPASSTSRPSSCASGATWRASGATRFVAERRRYEERIRDLFREGVERSELRTDLDVATAALLFLSAANWAYTWLRPGAPTRTQLADRLVRRAARRDARLRDAPLSRAGTAQRVAASGRRLVLLDQRHRAARAGSAARSRTSSGVSLIVRCGITSSNAPSYGGCSGQRRQTAVGQRDEALRAGRGAARRGRRRTSRPRSSSKSKAA